MSASLTTLRPLRIRQRVAGRLTTGIETQGKPQPAHAFLPFAVLPEEEAALAAKGGVVGAFHHRLADLVEPAQVGIDLSHTGVDLLRFVAAAQRQQTAAQAVGDAPVVGAGADGP